MFGRKTLAQKRIDSLIGAATTVRGDVVFEGGLRIDGTVLGNVTAGDGKAGTLVVSEHARIEGRVDVAHVVLNGTVHGPVTARDSLELQGKARIVGDVAYRTPRSGRGRTRHGQRGRIEACGNGPRRRARVTLKGARFDAPPARLDNCARYGAPRSPPK